MSVGRVGGDLRGVAARSVHSVFATTALSPILLPSVFLSFMDLSSGRVVVAPFTAYIVFFFPWSWFDILSQSVTAYRAKYHLQLFQKTSTFEHRAARYFPREETCPTGEQRLILDLSSVVAGWGKLWAHMVGSAPAGHRQKDNVVCGGSEPVGGATLPHTPGLHPDEVIDATVHPTHLAISKPPLNDTSRGYCGK